MNIYITKNMTDLKYIIRAVEYLKEKCYEKNLEFPKPTYVENGCRWDFDCGGVWFRAAQIELAEDDENIYSNINIINVDDGHLSRKSQSKRQMRKGNIGFCKEAILYAFNLEEAASLLIDFANYKMLDIIQRRDKNPQYQFNEREVSNSVNLTNFISFWSSK